MFPKIYKYIQKISDTFLTIKRKIVNTKPVKVPYEVTPM